MTVLKRKGRRGQGMVALLFLLPLLLFYVIYYVYGFIFLAGVSTQRVSLTFVNAQLVGWSNYWLVLTDPLFQTSLLNTLLFAGISILAALTIGFFLAVLLATGVRLRQVFYALFLLPSLVHCLCSPRSSDRCWKPRMAHSTGCWARWVSAGFNKPGFPTRALPMWRSRSCSST